MRRLALLIALAAVLAACHNNTSTPTGVAVSIITLTVAPNPIATVETSATGPTFSIRFTSTIKESAGLGATVSLVKATLFDDATGVLLGQTLYDDKDLAVFVGSKRVEGNSTLDVEQSISYVATAKRNGSLTVTVNLTDDKGNAIERALLVKVT